MQIADAPEDFVRACEAAMAQDRAGWLPRVDAHLSNMSWDATWAHMKLLLDVAASRRWDETQLRNLQSGVVEMASV